MLKVKEFLLLFNRKVFTIPVYMARYIIATVAPLYFLVRLVKVRLLLRRPPKVVIVCENYSSYANMEAVTGEAKEVFQHLSMPQKEIVSIESGQISESKDVAVKTLSLEDFVRRLRINTYEIIHIFASDLHLFGLRDLARKRIVISVSSSDPLVGLEEEVFEEIQHLADHGMIYVVAQSEYVARILNDNGIKCRDIIYPGVSLDRFAPQEKAHNSFRIGFASSPMDDEHYETRGISLIIELARRLKDIEFHLAWRKQPERIETQVKELRLNNLIIKTGKLNMVSFYNSVDCIILPFTSKRKNHDAPLSAIESLACGRPVICTDVVGIADIIRREDVGLVVAVEINALEQAITSMRAEAERFSANARKVAENYFDIKKVAKRYEKLYKEIRQEFKTISLYDWKMRLKHANKQLAISREDITAYYQRKEVAERYSEDRFEYFPWKELNDLEISTLKAIMAEYSYSRRPMQIIDIASGNGRILQAIVESGSYCSGIETSDAMKKILTHKFGHNALVTIIDKDIFQFQTKDSYDIITCFRFLRHFQYRDRKDIYRIIRKCLKTNGICIADFPNKRVEVPLRSNIGWESFHIYDVFWDIKSLTTELHDNGFRVTGVYGVGKFFSLFNKLPFEKFSKSTLTPIFSRYYYDLEMKYLLDSSVDSNPLFWIVCFEKL